MTMWLSKKKKADLVDLCNEVGLRTDGLKKTELEQNLKQYLYRNESTLSTHPSFTAYYESIARSPQKRLSPPHFINPLDPILPEGTKRDRRQSTRFLPNVKSTRGYSESVDPDVGTTYLKNGIPETHTPSEPDSLQPSGRTGSATPVPIRRSARNAQVQPLSPSTQLLEPHFPTTPEPATNKVTSSLPPSPAVVANLVEASTDNVRARVHTFMNENITQAVSRRFYSTRETLSNVITVAMLVHGFEFGCVVRKLIPGRHSVTFSIPLVGANGTPTTMNLPDLFTVLEGNFWAPFATWVAVSIVIPGMIGVFINITKSPFSRINGSYKCDPVIFALAKSLLGWALFYNRIIENSELRVVEEAVGREVLVLVGSLLVGLVGLWEGLMTR